MRTKDFVKTYCIGTWCPHFEHKYGCRAYNGEECDEAWGARHWHDKSMTDRINEYCQKKYAKLAEEICAKVII